MQNKLKYSILLILLSASLACANYTCNFKTITSNNATNVNIGQNQLSLNVTDLGNSQAAFKFINKGTQNAVIEEIIFEDTSNMLSFCNFQAFESGVNFLVNKKKLNLPGGNQPSIDFTESYGFYAKNPAPHNGVGANKSLGIAFTYCNMSFDELINCLDNSQLRVGIHVTAFDNGGSESFMNCTTPQVPAPSSIALTCIGITAALKLKKRYT